MTNETFAEESFLRSIYKAIEVLITEQNSSFDLVQEKCGIDVQALAAEQHNLDISTLKLVSSAFDLSLSGFFRKMEELD